MINSLSGKAAQVRQGTSDQAGAWLKQEAPVPRHLKPGACRQASRLKQNQLSLLASVLHCCSTSQLLYREHFLKTDFPVSNYFSSCYRSNHNMAPTPMDFFDLANLLDNDGNLQNEMMVKVTNGTFPSVSR